MSAPLTLLLCDYDVTLMLVLSFLSYDYDATFKMPFLFWLVLFVFCCCSFDVYVSIAVFTVEMLLGIFNSRFD